MVWKDFFKNKYIMLEISNVKVYDLKESVIACRNAMRTEMPEYTDEEFEKSLERAKKLVKVSSGKVRCHASFRKGIRVSFDMKYTQYITKQFQRYHFFDYVSSSSLMHRIVKMDFSNCVNKYVAKQNIEQMQRLISKYNAFVEDKIEKYTFYLANGEILQANTHQEVLYYQYMRIISNCPMGTELFVRVSTNYETLANIYNQRKNHKLKEDWGAFCDFIKSLPYSKELITMED